MEGVFLFLFQLTGQKLPEKEKEKKDEVDKFLDKFANKIGGPGEPDIVKLTSDFKRVKKENPEEYEKIKQAIKYFEPEILEYAKLHKKDYYLAAEIYGFVAYKIGPNYEKLLSIKEKIKNEFKYDPKKFKDFLFSLNAIDDKYSLNKKVDEVYQNLNNEQKLTEMFGRDR
jgi:hypothetical protein